ncbi:MAG: hypothetical protein NFCOHLIN_00222 [Gammaproteobacteria bacterium]|nr:hypothetical protein [Gammaproteobacteria bacterium]
MSRVLLSLAAAAFNLSAMAADTSEAPESLSDASIGVMQADAKRYDDCLQIRTTDYLSAYEDVRAVADAAMKQCDAVLQHLDSELAATGMPQAARAGHIARIRDTVVRKLMPALAARQADGPASE